VLELTPFRSAVDPAWIDYNGHLNDACYALIFSKALDHMLDFVDLGAANRERTRCTMYTLETHINYLREVQGTDEVVVRTFLLDVDKKRMQVGLQLECDRLDTPAATMDCLLLHVHQGDKPSAAPFPEAAVVRLQALRDAQGDVSAFAPRSRKIELTRR
jgi:acyl-CoA thioester hydrolase